jgi:hypothetical protein
MRNPIFVACIVVTIAMTIRSFLMPLKSDSQKLETGDRSINNARSEDRLRDRDLLTPNPSQRESNVNSQSNVPEDVMGEFEAFHSHTSESFGRAMGFGVGRGGAHVLYDDGRVTFLSDDVDLEGSESNPYGLWGTLGTRASDQQAPPKVKNVEPVRNRQNHGRALLTARNERHSPHRVLAQTGFEVFAPKTGPSSPYPFRLEAIELVSTESRFIHVLGATESAATNASTHANSTRPLEPSEASAIEQLLTGGSTVFARSGDTINVVAAIRSREQCNACHLAKTGDVLGAFQYHLSLVDPRDTTSTQKQD